MEERPVHKALAFRYSKDLASHLFNGGCLHFLIVDS